MHKVMLIANPSAGSVSEPTKQVIMKALQADFKLEVFDTEAREHATELAEEAVDRDFDAVLAFGGDGTINEIAQPLVGTEVVLGLLPGGSTNVMARSLGVPIDPVEATAFVSEALADDSRRRRIGVGMVNERYFLFSCGIGLDAEVVKRVEEHAARTGKKSEWLFFRKAVAAASTQYRAAEPWLTAQVGNGEPEHGVIGIVCNGWPFTYFGPLPVDACPQASLDSKLDMVLFRHIRTTTIPRVAWAVLKSRSHTKWRKVAYHHDVDDITWIADEPRPMQVDGDYIGLHSEARLRHVPDSLTLLS